MNSRISFALSSLALFTMIGLFVLVTVDKIS